MADELSGPAGRTPGDGDRSADVERVEARARDDLDALADRRLKVGLLLTLAMLVIYFAFILLIAFDKDGMGDILTDGLSLGMLLGVIVIVATWVLTWIYVGWANRKYEPEIARLKAQARR